MPTRQGAKTRSNPAAGVAGHMLGKVRKNAAQGWKKALRRHPALGVALSIALAVLGVLMLIVGLFAENALYFLATALSGLGSLAVARARHLERQRQQQQAARRPTVSKPAAPPRAEQPTPPPADQAQGGVVCCTETGKPISDCGCASRHVATAEGAGRYGRPIGSPMGRRTKPAGTTKTSAGT